MKCLKHNGRTEQSAGFFLQAVNLEEIEKRITNFFDHMNKINVDITTNESIPVLNLAAAFGSPLFVSSLVAKGAKNKRPRQLIEHCRPQPPPKCGLISPNCYHRWIQTVTLEMKMGLRYLTMLLYPAAWKTKAALLENGYGMEIDAKSNDGYISLSAAANHGHLLIVESLKHGSEETVRDKRGTNVAYDGSWYWPRGFSLLVDAEH